MGFTTSKIYKVVALYNKNGADFTASLNWGGRRNATSHMSFEQEQIFMNELALTAVNGNVLVAKHIRELIEKNFVDLFLKIIYGIYSKDTIGKRKCQDQSIQRKTKKLRKSLKKTPRNIGNP